ncbi:MAG: hypothetical protein ACK44Q_20790, partial [Pirellulaceae bacterium]
MPRRVGGEPPGAVGDVRIFRLPFFVIGAQASGAAESFGRVLPATAANRARRRLAGFLDRFQQRSLLPGKCGVPFGGIAID